MSKQSLVSRRRSVGRRFIPDRNLNPIGLILAGVHDAAMELGCAVLEPSELKQHKVSRKNAEEFGLFLSELFARCPALPEQLAGVTVRKYQEQADLEKMGREPMALRDFIVFTLCTVEANLREEATRLLIESLDAGDQNRCRELSEWIETIILVLKFTKPGGGPLMKG